ncbi:di-trans,poly-cis-decaprenylcistransferase [Peptostreptococcaceae bacterium oral taxon 113 str. W5053]|nr:di-trans,poly-cis-decaprenylcistransferase [Peptostreptococcaceae bacterium oral taxon 113 str. W5053]
MLDKDEILKENIRIPNHLAIIMDGNGRWATQFNKSRSFGHYEGMKRVIDIVKASSDIGIKYLSLYAFSTENWKRPLEEVSYLMDLILVFLNKQIKHLHENNVKLNILGILNQLPPKQIKKIEEALKLTENNTGLILNIALNYGSKDEIFRAVKKMINDVWIGAIDKDSITEELFYNQLDTGNMPDVDLLIRPGGEKRLSNFMLVQNAYSEIIFTDVLWPDFSEKKLIQCLEEYTLRERRFGGL